ncbi:MAG TPA: Fic family protein [Candidatus Obscuribacterales bacterium]
MTQEQSSKFFQEKHIPPETTPAGFAALMRMLKIESKAPLRIPACVSDHYVKGGVKTQDGWQIYDKRYQPEDTLEDHLAFALKHEVMDLLVLRRICLALPKEPLAQYVSANLGKTIPRRAWFFYELVTGNELDVPPVPKNVPAVDALDRKEYFTQTPGSISRRHKVRDNLLGNSKFCPIIRQTEKLNGFISGNYSAKAKGLVGAVSPDLVARAASFLLLADTKASFAIEGETPPIERINRWCRAVQQSADYPLSIEELERLQNILIVDHRLVQPGVRKKMVFLGTASRYEDELPEFIPAKSEDLMDLLEGLISVNKNMTATGAEPVLQAAVIAFGFVFIHPFEDGNGRIHRCLIHSILEQRGYTPPEMIFPVSSVMASRMKEYANVLKRHSAPLMPYVKWQYTESGIEVLNDTADLYRYFDCTELAEFLYECVVQAIDQDIPLEIDYLRRHDRAMASLMNAIEMPDSVASKFIMFVRQNNWSLPRNRREKEFRTLSDHEVTQLEKIVRDAFDGFPDQGLAKAKA